MPDTPERRKPLTLLAFDFGYRRIGAAVGQQVTGSANPLGTATNGPAGPDWVQIARWIAEWRPDRLVVGMPLHADGTRSDMTAAVETFAADLARFGLPIETVDERYSSLEAEEMLRDARARGMRGRVRKETIDAAAAMLIAERWLSQNS
jgi:putative Holliday junction resolvase